MSIENDILELFRKKDIDRDWSFADCKPSQTTKLTHGYHRYPAKFIPQLVERLFDEYLDGESAAVNDPFMGSGTTMVCAISRGYRASGTDVNRIAFLIAKAKCTPIEPTLLETRLKRFFERLGLQNTTQGEDPPPLQDVEPLLPAAQLDRIRYWFPEDNIVKLGQILGIANEEADPAIRCFLLVGFSNILKKCSIWLKSSTKPTRDFKKRPDEPYTAMKRQLEKMRQGNAAFYAALPNAVRSNPEDYLHLAVGDARTQPVAANSVDLVVTSSPYVTSYEYADLHQLSTIWLDLAEDLAAYKKEFIGTARKRYDGRQPSGNIARSIVAEMSAVDRKVAQEVEAFFLDMQEVIAESHRILKPGGRACYVIGDTKLKGVDILNAEVFAETMIGVGFELDRIIRRQIPSKILPQTRDARSGRFSRAAEADSQAYPTEYVVIGRK